VVDAARPEALLRDQEARTFCAERVRDRHAHVPVEHLTVGRPALAHVPQDRNRTHDLNARRVGGDDDLRGSGVRRRIRIGHGHHNPEGRALRA